MFHPPALIVYRLRASAFRMKFVFVGLFVSGLLGVIHAADWPQYRGPNSDGKSLEAGILKKWPSEGPKEIWKREVHLGFSSFTVSGGKAFTLEQRSIDGVDREV